jgi:hypothetical protein
MAARALAGGDLPIEGAIWCGAPRAIWPPPCLICAGCALICVPCRAVRVWIYGGAGEEAVALRAFARVAMNEYADLDLRYVMGAPLEHLAGQILAPGTEREIELTGRGCASRVCAMACR